MTENIISEAEVADSWDRNADLWARQVTAGLDLYRELYTFPAFLDFLPPISGKKVIDLGCGEGANTRAFARLGAHMTGVDLSPEMIRRAREKEGEDPLGIAYEVGSYSSLTPFADSQFDSAVSTMALMDGPELGAAFHAAHRVLKPNGTLCFSVLHPCFITPAIQWLKDEHGAYAGLRVGRYFEQKPFVEYWRFRSGRNTPGLQQPNAPFEVPRFPRTLSDYINALVEAGFQIRKIEEPRPMESIAKEHEWLQRWYQHAPLVLFILAAKA